jgi:predicted metal-binding protein
MKFTTTASCEPEVYPYLMTYQTDPKIPQDIKDKAAKFWQGWKDSKQKMLVSVVALEKAAMKQGYSLAMAFISGHCQLCEKCNTETKICRHPELMRISEDAIGVNVKKTAANAGIHYQFPFSSSADSFALLLIE